MKKLALLVSLVALTSCTKHDPIPVQMKINNSSESVRKYMQTFEFGYNGHDYIMFTYYGNSNTIGIVHNPDCHCKKVE